MEKINEKQQTYIFFEKWNLQISKISTPSPKSQSRYIPLALVRSGLSARNNVFSPINIYSFTIFCFKLLIFNVSSF